MQNIERAFVRCFLESSPFINSVNQQLSSQLSKLICSYSGHWIGYIGSPQTVKNQKYDSCSCSCFINTGKIFLKSFVTFYTSYHIQVLKSNKRGKLLGKTFYSGTYRVPFQSVYETLEKHAKGIDVVVKG